MCFLSEFSNLITPLPAALNWMMYEVSGIENLGLLAKTLELFVH